MILSDEVIFMCQIHRISSKAFDYRIRLISHQLTFQQFFHAVLQQSYQVTSVLDDREQVNTE